MTAGSWRRRIASGSRSSWVNSTTCRSLPTHARSLARPSTFANASRIVAETPNLALASYLCRMTTIALLPLSDDDRECFFSVTLRRMQD
jgi:hypothetical protein